jgi:hypothetical protein
MFHCALCDGLVGQEPIRKVLFFCMTVLNLVSLQSQTRHLVPVL